jgi:hypothetical protein
VLGPHAGDSWGKLGGVVARSPRLCRHGGVGAAVTGVGIREPFPELWGCVRVFGCWLGGKQSQRSALQSATQFRSAGHSMTASGLRTQALPGRDPSSSPVLSGNHGAVSRNPFVPPTQLLLSFDGNGSNEGARDVAVGVRGPPVPVGTAGGPVALARMLRGRPHRVDFGESARRLRPHGRLVGNDAMSSFVVVSVPGNSDDLGEP